MVRLIPLLFTILLCFSVAHGATVTLSWDPSPDPVDGYTIFYGESSVLVNPALATITVGSEILTCQVTTLVPGHKYYFALKAFNRYGISGFSNEVTYTPPINSVPAPPVGLRVTSS